MAAASDHEPVTVVVTRRVRPGREQASAPMGLPRSPRYARPDVWASVVHETWTVGDVVAKVEPVLVVNDLEIACDAAIAGVGVARLPSLVCRDAVHAGRLQLVFGAEPALSPAVYAVFPSRAYLPAKVRTFVDALASHVDPMLPIEPR